MAEVTNELMYEVLKRIQERLDRIEGNTRDTSMQLHALREYTHATSRDVANIYEKLASHDSRLERIERRLDLIGEPAH